MPSKYGGYQDSELLVELYDYSNSAVEGVDFYVYRRARFLHTGPWRQTTPYRLPAIQ